MDFLDVLLRDEIDGWERTFWLLPWGLWRCGRAVAVTFPTPSPRSSSPRVVHYTCSLSRVAGNLTVRGLVRFP